MKIYPSARHSCYFYAQLASRCLVWAMNHRELSARETDPGERRKHRNLMRYAAKDWLKYAQKARDEEVNGYEFMPRDFLKEQNRG